MRNEEGKEGRKKGREEDKKKGRKEEKKKGRKGIKERSKEGVPIFPYFAPLFKKYLNHFLNHSKCFKNQVK